MRKMLGEIQALNVVGVECMEHGDYEQAAEAFSHAISQLSNSLLLPTPIGGGTGNSNNHQDTKQAKVEVFACEEEMTDDDSAKSDFYTHPFHFECELARGLEEPALTSEQYNTFAISSLFNLGLCFHLKWLEQKMHTHLLKKALSFYEQAISLVPSCSLTPKDSVLKVLLAVCANGTHVNNELVNLEQARQWNKTLKDILAFTEDDDLIVSESYFSMNAFFNSFGRIAAQAA